MTVRPAAVALLVGLTMLAVEPTVHAQYEPDEAFLAWARSALHPIATTQMSAPMADLEPLGAIVGDAKIVALSETLHGAAESLAFRNRLFRYLVERQHFSAIVIESGVVESEVLNAYVLGKEGELPDVLKHGLGWTFDILPQNAELVSWMREYNSTRPAEAAIQLYGLDVPGSPGNDRATHGPEVALQRALAFLDLVDPDVANEFRRRVGPHLPRLQSGYGDISQADRDALTIAITEIIGAIEVNQWDYTAATNEREYEWAHRAAIGARQVDAWLRQWPVGWAASDYTELQVRATRLRDRAMADNLDWIVQELGPEARLMVFAAATHLATAPVTYVEAPINTSLGTHAKHRYRDGLLTVTTLIGGGTVGGCGEYPLAPLSDAPSATVNGLMRRLEVPLFVLDFRAATPAVESWLSEVRDVWSGYSVRKVRLNEAFDVGFFVDSYSSACE